MSTLEQDVANWGYHRLPKHHGLCVSGDAGDSVSTSDETKMKNIEYITCQNMCGCLSNIPYSIPIPLSHY